MRKHFILAGAALAALVISGPVSAQTAGSIEKGRVIFAAGGCGNCHTDKKNKGPVAGGGAALKTPFGDFFGPNITPDQKNGLGKWSEADFIKAMREGQAPDGRHYFPVFPYPSFTYMSDTDLKNLWAFMKTLKPSGRVNKKHDIAFPFNLNFGQGVWKSLFFKKGPFKPVTGKSEEWNRGAYLSVAVSHCGECHTPRNKMGALSMSDWFSGVEEGKGPEGEAVPAITNDEAGIGSWSVEEIAEYLKSGETPDGDFVGSLMAEVIDGGTSELSDADRKAIAVYVKSAAPPN